MNTTTPSALAAELAERAVYIAHLPSHRPMSELRNALGTR